MVLVTKQVTIQICDSHRTPFTTAEWTSPDNVFRSDPTFLASFSDEIVGGGLNPEDLQANADFNLEIAFEEGGPAAQLPVVSTLDSIRRFLEDDVFPTLA